MTTIRTVAVLNNEISSELTIQDITARDIDLREVAVILLRDVYSPWMDECALTLRYPGKPALHVLEQRRFINFYRRAARVLRRIKLAGTLQNIYIVNNDNLITSHLLAAAGDNMSISVTVVAEGLMNFQNIGVANRAGWRWRMKPWIAAIMRYRYRLPVGHLSGAFEPHVKRVITFAAGGMVAPREKLVILPFARAQVRRQADPGVALVALTGLNAWMSPQAFVPFAHAFNAWLRSQGFHKIQVKRHPRCSGGLIEELLSDAEVIGEGESVEGMASTLEAGTVIGYCCTAIATLKIIRPDIRCVDYGSDYYSKHAYSEQDSVKDLFSAVGVEMVQVRQECLPILNQC